jgi:WD40 repeat protein
MGMLVLAATTSVSAQQKIDGVRTLSGHRRAILSVTYSANGKSIVTGGIDGTVKVWDRATGQLIRSIDRLGQPEDCEARSSCSISRDKIRCGLSRCKRRSLVRSPFRPTAS